MTVAALYVAGVFLVLLLLSFRRGRQSGRWYRVVPPGPAQKPSQTRQGARGSLPAPWTTRGEAESQHRDVA